MDPQIKKRMVNKIIIHPFIKISSGDKIFDEPIEFNGMIISKIGDYTDEYGESHTFNNKIIIEGSADDFISTMDEIELVRIGRVPIKSVASYNSLRPGKQLIEVYC